MVGLAVSPGASAFVYWINNTSTATIGRANLDGSSPNYSFITPPTRPQDITVDSSFIYLTNPVAGTVERVNLDGTGPVNTSFIPGGNGTFGVAVDGQHVYWTNKGNNTIGRANLDGSSPQQDFITGANAPRGIAVDGTHLYWVNTDGSDIGRAQLTGCSGSPPCAVTQTLVAIPGGSNAWGIAVDAQYIYWSRNNTGDIGRAKLDGTDPDQTFISGTSCPAGLAVDAAHLYWATFPCGNTIGRADFRPDENFITGASAPYGVAVDGLAPSPGTTTGMTPTTPGGVAGPLPLPTTRTRPVISALTETHSVFAVGPISAPLLGRTARRTPRGTTFSFRLSQPGVVAATIQRKLPGRRVGRLCKPPTRQLLHRPSCTRLLTKATLRRTAHVGLNKLAFSGRIRGHALPAGYYRAAFIAANSAGISALRALSFRIVAR